MKLSSKLILYISLFIFILIVSFSTYAIANMNAQVTHLAEQKMVSNTKLATALLDVKFPGEWTLKDGKLFKGEVSIEGNHDVALFVGALTGDDIVIFKGEKGVAASSKGSHNMNITEIILESNVKSIVLGGKSYVGEAHDGTEMAVYEPIRSSDGTVIGAFHISMGKEMYNQAISRFKVKMIVFTMIGLLIALILTALFTRKLTAPLRQVTIMAERVANGDLSITDVPVTSKDELGILSRAFNLMTHNLHTLVSKAQQAADEVHKVSGVVQMHINGVGDSSLEIDRTLQSILQGASKQVEGMNQSMEAVEHIQISIQEIVQRSSQVASASENMVVHADQGNDWLLSIISVINHLNASITHVASKIQQLSDSSGSIGNIATVITDLSSQTHLLSLNASIEAARAGEAGRGFSVVADEVKKLAEQSENSAQEIRILIEKVQHITSEAAEGMNTSLAQLTAGNQHLISAGKSFEQIIISSQHVASQNQNVYQATRQISTDSHYISDSVADVTTIAEHTSSRIQGVVQTSDMQSQMVNQISGALENMSQSVDQLLKSIRIFKL